MFVYIAPVVITMIIRKIRQIKESRVIAIPTVMCDCLGIGGGDRMQIEFENKKIILTPVEPSKAPTEATNSQPLRSGGND